jgi:hypothetical protein
MCSRKAPGNTVCYNLSVRTVSSRDIKVVKTKRLTLELLSANFKFVCSGT